MPDFVSRQEAEAGISAIDSFEDSNQNQGVVESVFTDYPHLAKENQEALREVEEQPKVSSREAELEKRVAELEGKIQTSAEPVIEAEEEKPEVITLDGPATDYYGQVIGELFEDNNIDWRGMNYHYLATGELKEEHYKTLGDLGINPQMIDNYLYGSQAKAKAQAKPKTQPTEQPQKSESKLSDENRAQIINEIGGSAEVAKLLDYTDKNWSKDQIAEIQAVINSGNYEAARFAVKTAYRDYKASLGKEGKSYTKGSGNSRDGGFRNATEKKAAMDDVRYGMDYDYTEMVDRKIALQYVRN